MDSSSIESDKLRILEDSISSVVKSMTGDRSILIDAFKKFSRNTSTEFLAESRYGLFEEYFGTDSSNALLRNRIHGKIQYQLSDLLSAEMQIQLVDKNLPFNQNTYFTFNLVPNTRNGVPSIPADFTSKLQRLDSLDRMGLNMLATVEAKLSKMERQKERLELFKKVGIKPNYKLDTSKIEKLDLSIPDLELDESKRAELMAQKEKLLELVEKIGTLKELLSMPNVKAPEISSTPKMDLKRLQIGRMQSNPKGAVVGTQIDGIGFEVQSKKLFYIHQSGISKDVNAQFNNPIDKILQMNNQPLDRYFVQGRRFISSSEIGYGTKRGDHVLIRNGFTSRAMGSTQTQILQASYLSHLNSISFKYSLKQLKGLIVFSEFGKLSTDSIIGFGEYFSSKSNNFQNAGTEYTIASTKTVLRLEVENVQHQAYQLGYSELRKDFVRTSAKVTQKITSYISLQAEQAQILFRSAILNAVSRSNTSTIYLSLNPVEGLSWTSGLLYSHSILQNDTRETVNNKLWTHSGSYRVTSDELEYHFGLSSSIGSIQNFENVVQMENYTINGSLSNDKISLSNSYSFLSMKLVPILDIRSRMNSLKLTYLLGNSCLRLIWDWSFLDNGSDHGGKMELEKTLNKRLSGKLSIQKYVQGSIASVFQPIRFERNPFELQFQLTYKL